MMRNATRIAVALLSCSALAAAQDANPKADPKAQQTVEIIGDRVPNLDKTPVSGNFLDAAELERRRITSVQELTNQVPNVTSTDNGTRSFGDAYSVRGLTNGAFFSGPALGLYVDDIPFGDPYTYAEPMGLLDSAKVLRGPQFTQFGRYPYGGIVNVVTRRPTDKLEGGIFGEGGNYGQLNSGGYLMGALIPGQLRFRVGVSEQTSGGVIYNDFRREQEDNQQRVGGNFSVFYTPTPDWEVGFISSVQKYQDGGARMNSLTAADPYVVSSDYPGRMIRNTDMEALRVATKQSGVQILSVTARRNYNLSPYEFDLDFSPFPGNFSRIEQEQTQLSQEFRVSSDTPNSDLSWVVGVYGHLKNTHQDGVHDFGFPNPDPIFTFPPAFGFGPFWTQHGVNSYTDHQHWAALFADAAYKAAPAWTVRLGARFDYVSESIKRSDVATLDQPFGPFSSSYDLSDNYPMPSFKAGVDYTGIDNVLLYVNGGHAYKPGGFSAFTASATASPFKNEKTWFAEMGGKSGWFDNKLHANASLYYYGIHGYQMERSIPQSSEYLVINTETAQSYGAEAELRTDVIPHVELFAGVGTARTTLGTYTDPSVPGAFGGTFPASTPVTHAPGAVAPFVPRYNAQVGATATYSGVFSTIQWVATGLTHYDDLNPTFNQDNYGVLNGAVGYTAERFQITLFGTNLNTRFYYTNMTSSINAGSPALPRMMGVRLDLSF
jgi:iron complex outermembrane receptor protein